MNSSDPRSAPSHRLLWSLLAFMIFFWALNFTVGKVAVREFPPLLAAGLRLLVSAVLILPLYFWQGSRLRTNRWSLSDVPLLFGLGAVGIAGNQILFLLGIKRTSVAHASLLFGLAPIFVLLIAAIIGQERISLRKSIGLGIAFTGVIVLQGSAASGGGATVSGDLLILGATLAFSLFTVFGKNTTVRLGSITVNTFGYVISALALAPLTIWESRGFDFSSISAAGWGSILYMGVFPSVVSYVIYYYALGYLAASHVAALVYLEPVLAILIAIPLLGESVTSSVAAGGALVLTGVWVTERGR